MPEPAKLRCIGGPPPPCEHVVRNLEGLLQQAREGRVRAIAYVTALDEPYQTGRAVAHDGEYSSLMLMQAQLPHVVEHLREALDAFGQDADLPELEDDAGQVTQLEPEPDGDPA